MSAIRGLGTRLAIISESHTGRFLSPSQAPGGRLIDIRTALAGDEVVLFSLNSSTYGKLAAQIGTLVVQDLVTAAGHNLTTGAAEARAGPAIIGIDEFSALGADNVIALLARGREAGVSVLLATQELADLDRAARGLRDQVLGNTAVKIAHRQDVPASAQHGRADGGHREAMGGDAPDRSAGSSAVDSGPRHAPGGRAVHRRPQRDQDAPHRRGGRDRRSSHRRGWPG